MSSVRLSITSKAARPLPSLHTQSVQHARNLRTRAQAVETAQSTATATVVTTIPPSKQPGPPPESVPIVHSSAYLLNNRAPYKASNTAEHSSRLEHDEHEDGNALQRVLRRVDDSLTEFEHNASPTAKQLVGGPLGKATVRSMQTAAELTAAAGAQALKVAVPVGKWALQQGFKAAVQIATNRKDSNNNGSRKRS